MNQIIKVLIVDDSAYVRKMVKEMLYRSPFIEVVGTAHNGQEALELVEQLNPDVVTLDLIMPEMDGVEFLRQQMAKRPIPAIVVSIASEDGQKTLAALEAGAVDFVHKPTALATEKIFEISDDLIEKVKAAATIAPHHLLGTEVKPQVVSSPLSAQFHKSVDLVAIGISTGGPQALANLIPQLPSDFPVPIAIVLHMPVGYTDMYARRLDEQSSLTVLEAEEGQILRPGLVTIAKAGRHLKFLVHSDGTTRVHLDARPFDTLHRPSVDVMFRSAADVFGARVLGVVMTGMGCDGKEGAAWIKAKGGTIVTEAEESCVVYGMPRSLVEAGLSDRQVPLKQMAQVILNSI
ncbi:protein-glutamate methylesterase/protein-glutamine glutaminase [Oxynema aestuarii]|uniref:Protein-glutamate methylesterase/protein-glutamine glutaminase n=1 Tax=Oxynema aestuarii AP17 TaxID=2064643 RepID=A0A6H1TUH0_9CYAN|nr:chemotaxis response regulator protein-glutamate methylesterase [Oxynema aestuarii]QIZ70254.1 chemotaxis response regulator protein-glutamate methylesterase [Oxynema aestuarii AP17]